MVITFEAGTAGWDQTRGPAGPMSCLCQWCLAVCQRCLTGQRWAEVLGLPGTIPAAGAFPLLWPAGVCVVQWDAAVFSLEGSGMGLQERRVGGLMWQQQAGCPMGQGEGLVQSLALVGSHLWS